MDNTIVLIDDAALRAFGQGYYDGYAKGKTRDLSCLGRRADGTTDHLAHYYRRGYDAGVADYCAIELENEEC